VQLEWLFRIWRGQVRKRGPVRRDTVRKRHPRSETELFRSPPGGFGIGASTPSPVPPPPPIAAIPSPPVYSPPPPPVRVGAPFPPQIDAVPRPDAGATRIIGANAERSSAVVGVLIGIQGKHEGQIYKLCDGNNIVGRSQAAHVALDDRDDTVSREHVEIIHENGVFGLKLLKENNPAWVDDEEVSVGTGLCDGAQIRIGQSTFRFRTA